MVYSKVHDAYIRVTTFMIQALGCEPTQAYRGLGYTLQGI